MTPTGDRPGDVGTISRQLLRRVVRFERRLRASAPRPGPSPTRPASACSSPSTTSVGAVYLAGSAVAQAAPTPGGLGAMEAALVAGLRAAGMAAGIALPAVFMFRFATFWLPILPGWGCFTYLRRAELV